MAYLLGQLNIAPNPDKAIELLGTSALIAERLSEPDTAAPMYIYAMMLAGEFDAPNLTPELLPQNQVEAGQWMKKAAFLNHAPAQYKCGHGYEYASLGFNFDPLLSVQYYSLASQQVRARALFLNPSLKAEWRMVL
jgi:TPR repeat protein